MKFICTHLNLSYDYDNQFYNNFESIKLKCVKCVKKNQLVNTKHKLEYDKFVSIVLHKLEKILQFRKRKILETYIFFLYVYGDKRILELV